MNGVISLRCPAPCEIRRANAPVLHFAVENRIIDGVGGFGFTRALIFPYDELDFCRSSAWAGYAPLAFRLRWGRNALFL